MLLPNKMGQARIKSSPNLNNRSPNKVVILMKLSAFLRFSKSLRSVVTQDNKSLKRTFYVHVKCRLTSGISETKHVHIT